MCVGSACAPPMIRTVPRTGNNTPGQGKWAALTETSPTETSRTPTQGRSNRSLGGSGLPKMVLVGDIVGDDADAVARATSEVIRLANARSGEGFVAVSADARKKFWLDRKRTAAISRHTNAFKINEDVVIPLPRMAEYTDGIERINIELSLRNKIKLCDALTDFLERGNLPLGKHDDANEIPSAELLEDRVAQAVALVAEVRALWSGWLQDVATLFPQLQDHTLRASWKTQLRAPLQGIFAGAAFKPILDEATAIHQRVLKGRVWVALHMHAGDGNVHTNLPVNSDDYEMLQTAHQAVERIMVLARSLDGVISGEHGIGGRCGRIGREQPWVGDEREGQNREAETGRHVRRILPGVPGPRAGPAEGLVYHAGGRRRKPRVGRPARR